MKINLLVYYLIATIILLFSCKQDTQKQLARLRQEQTAISEKIRTLEEQLADVNDSTDAGKFKLVGVTEIKPAPFDHYIRVQGKLDGDENAAVYAEAPGTISARYADVGEKVVKGQVLAQIDDSQYRGQLESLETQYGFAKEMFEKQQRLWEQKIGSEVQFLQSRTNVETLEKQIASLRDQISKFRIKSPITGTVEEVNVKVGGVVSPDPRLAAFRVVSFNNLKVTAEVSESYSSLVHPGDRVLVRFPDIEKDVVSSVDFVSKYINPVNRTFLLESSIPGTVEGLKANMIAIVRINDYHADSALQLPVNIIQTDLSGSYVYVVRPSDNYYAAYKTPVEIGNTYNGIAEIKKGVSAGDRIVSSGFRELVDGDYVRLNEDTGA